jgi:hypothetical protein
VISEEDAVCFSVVEAQAARCYVIFLARRVRRSLSPPTLRTPET